MGEADIGLEGRWIWRGEDLTSDHIAVRALVSDLQDFYGIIVEAGSGSTNVIRLSVQPGAVTTEVEPELDQQAYRLRIDASGVEIVGNSEQGLYYGVQTFLQLVKRNASGRLLIPEIEIRDWPSLELRILHWDTKHHQDRIETLKRYLDWAARFKVNGISFELEDKFEYPSNPIIGAPGAFTTEELQEIVDYGLERFIQVIPNVQSPAHMAYALKHEQFAHLRADGMNYQACLCDEKSYDLIFSMYEDVINATQGVDYFHVSTDEVYYAGICDKCEKPYNPENRSLSWVEFANRAHKFMSEHNRRMILWVEYPLFARHIPLLPPDVIDGVLGNDQSFIETENRHGIRQLVYTSMQGSEYLFPNYWSAESGDFRSRQGRLWSTFNTLTHDAWRGNPIGTFGAAWGDSGLHNETFWLGWSTVAQYGWTHGTPSVEQHIADFMQTYYGEDASGMVEIYQELQQQARFFQNSWDRVVSSARGSGYGNSYGKGIGVIRRDDTLPQPAIPTLPGLDFVPVYDGEYAELVEKARLYADRAQLLVQRLYSNLSGVEQNGYNLEVLLSLALFTRQHDQMIISLKEIENHLSRARESAESDRARQAVSALIAAYEEAQSTVEARKETFESLQKIWEKSRYPKGQSVDGREFVHILDDVKDHWADRRPDLSYMVAPQESINLEGWMEQFSKVLRSYADQHGVEVDSITLELEPEE